MVNGARKLEYPGNYLNASCPVRKVCPAQRTALTRKLKMTSHSVMYGEGTRFASCLTIIAVTAPLIRPMLIVFAGNLDPSSSGASEGPRGRPRARGTDDDFRQLRPGISYRDLVLPGHNSSPSERRRSGTMVFDGPCERGEFWPIPSGNSVRDGALLAAFVRCSLVGRRRGLSGTMWAGYNIEKH